MPQKNKKTAPAGAAGHRERMRESLIRNGALSFTDYRLLEILLYTVYTRCDTRDIAYKLIERFGSLEGVFAASVRELEQVENVGKAAASFIRLIGSFLLRLDSIEVSEPEYIGSSNQLGELFMSNRSRIPNESLLAAAFNADGALLRLGCCKPTLRSISEFIHVTGANAVAFAASSQNGELIPDSDMRELIAELGDFLDRLDVDFRGYFYLTETEQILIGEDFPDIELVNTDCNASKRALTHTCRETSEPKSTSCDIPEIKTLLLNNAVAALTDMQVMAAVLSFQLPKSDILQIAWALLDRFGSLEGVLNADTIELTRVDGIDIKCAVYLKTLGGLREMKKLPPKPCGRACRDSDEIGRILCAEFPETSPRVESILLAAFTEDRKLICTHSFTEISPNSCAIPWRTVAEFVHRTGASLLALAHDHTNEPIPSVEDRFFTVELAGFLASIGVGFLGHFLCAGNQFVIIEPEL